MAGKLRKNKKGSLLDIILIAVLLLFFGIIVLIGYKVTDGFNTQIQGMAILPNESKTASTTLLGYYPGIIDNAFLFLTICLAIGAIVLAALVRVHPIFLIFFLIALILVIFLCGILSNIYQGMAADSNLIAQADNLTFISLILNYLPFVVGIFGFILMMIMYKLGQDG